jgi:hypothetical protein
MMSCHSCQHFLHITIFFINKPFYIFVKIYYLYCLQVFSTKINAAFQILLNLLKNYANGNKSSEINEIGKFD